MGQSGDSMEMSIVWGEQEGGKWSCLTPLWVEGCIPNSIAVTWALVTILVLWAPYLMLFAGSTLGGFNTKDNQLQMAVDRKQLTCQHHNLWVAHLSKMST